MDSADERVLLSWYRMGTHQDKLPGMLEHFGVHDATELVALLASRGCVERNPLALEIALAVAAGEEIPPPMERLVEAIGAPWHGITEELIRVVSMEGGVDVVPVLVRIASQPPACLFDVEAVTASNNALYGLKRIGTDEARHAIENACTDPREYVAATARMLLAKME